MKNSKRRTSKAAKSQFIALYGPSMRSEIALKVDNTNKTVEPERRVSFKTAVEVANRDLARTLTYSPQVRVFSALRAVDSFISFAVSDRRTESSLKNSDLLPVGHPASTREHSMTASALRHAQARWIAADSYVLDEYRPLVAAAYAAAPGSVARTHAFVQLSLAPSGAVPTYLRVDELKPLVATFGLGIGGNSRAARSLRARMQRRDRIGRFAEMGGGWIFNLRLPNGIFHKVSGRVVGQSGDENVDVEVRGSRFMPDGVYSMPSMKGESVKGVLPEEALKGLPNAPTSVAMDDVYVDYKDLMGTRLGAPDGWEKTVLARHKSGQPSRVEWVNNDTAYSVIENLSSEGDRDGALELRRGLDNSVVGSGDDWGDVQILLDKDQPDYIKTLQSAEDARVAKETGAPEAKAELPSEITPPPPPKSPTAELTQGDNILKMIDEAIANKSAVRFNYGGKDRTFFPERVYKSENGNWNVQGVDVSEDDGTRRTVSYTFGPKMKPVKKRIATLEKAPEGLPALPNDITPGTPDEIKNQLILAAARGETVRFSVGGRDVTFSPQSIEQLRGTDAIVKGIDPANGTETAIPLSVVEPALSAQIARDVPSVVESKPKVSGNEPKRLENIGDVPKLAEEIKGAIDSGDSVAFNYNDTPRIVSPSDTYFNPKNGNTNVVGRDVGANGSPKTYTIDKIAALDETSPALEGLMRDYETMNMMRLADDAALAEHINGTADVPEADKEKNRIFAINEAKARGIENPEEWAAGPKAEEPKKSPMADIWNAPVEEAGDQPTGLPSFLKPKDEAGEVPAEVSKPEEKQVAELPAKTETPWFNEDQWRSSNDEYTGDRYGIPENWEARVTSYEKISQGKKIVELKNKPSQVQFLSPDGDYVISMPLHSGKLDYSGLALYRAGEDATKFKTDSLVDAGMRDWGKVEEYISADKVRRANGEKPVKESDLYKGDRHGAPEDWQPTIEAKTGETPVRVVWKKKDQKFKEPGYAVVENLNPDGTTKGDLEIEWNPDGSRVGTAKTWDEVAQKIEADKPRFDAATKKQAEEAPSAPKPEAKKKSTAPEKLEYDETLEPNPVDNEYESRYVSGNFVRLIDPQDGSEYILPDDGSDAIYDATRDGFKIVGPVPGKQVESPTYRKSTGKTAKIPGNAQGTDISRYLVDAQRDGSNVRFIYNGKERIFQPGRFYRNKKTGEVNVVGYDSEKGKDTTYTVSKISGIPTPQESKERPTIKFGPSAPEGNERQSRKLLPPRDEIDTRVLVDEKKEKEARDAEREKKRREERKPLIEDRVNDPDNWELVPKGRPATRYEWEYIGPWDSSDGLPPQFPPSGVTGYPELPSVIPQESKERPTIKFGPSAPEGGPSGPLPLKSTDSESMRLELDDAIASGDTVTFDYHGKSRVFDPKRVYYNPKTGNTNVVGFDHETGDEKTYTIEKIEMRPVDTADIDSIDALVDAEFDNLYETPDGSYKPDIFSMYEPQGRTTQKSEDYTDDPEVLSTKFSKEELALALRQAVLPDDDGEPATGLGELEFDAGNEYVPAEAIYEALGRQGIAADEMLARIYDSWSEGDYQTRGESNYDRVSAFNREMNLDFETSPLRNEIPSSESGYDALRSLETTPTPHDMQGNERVRQQLMYLDEPNEQVKNLAEYFRRQEILRMEDLVDKVDELIATGNPEDDEAAMAAWGVLMSIDGGDSEQELDRVLEQSPDDSWRRRMFEHLVDKSGGDVEVAKSKYEEIVDKMGSYADYIRSRTDLTSGNSNIDFPSLAAALYRLVYAIATANPSRLWRVTPIRTDDPSFKAYTTPGSIVTMSPSSWTSMNLTDGGLASQLFMHGVRGENGSRIVFEAGPGDLERSLDLTGISWFEGENETIAGGQMQVVSVKKVKRFDGSYEYHVQVKRHEETPAESAVSPGPAEPQVRRISGLENWKRTAAGTGSNDGGFYQDPDGNRYYVKVPQSKNHAENEALAGLFYRILGVPAAEVALGDDNGELRIVSPLVPDADLEGFFEAVDVSKKKVRNKEYVDKLKEHFAIDAWLGNYDVLGYLFDGSTNIVSDGNGDPIRVDPGGALVFRARGSKKGAMFGKTAENLDSMRDPDTSEQGAMIFGDMTDDELRESAMALREMTPSRIDAIVDSVVTDPAMAEEIKSKLKSRRADILDRFGIPEGVDDPEMFPDPQPIVEPMSYEAQDLMPGDRTSNDSFVIEKIFKDEETPKGKVSVQGYYPGHESQRKEWNERTQIDVVRGAVVPPKGDKPALHRPKAPRKPSPGAFTGRMQEMLSGVTSWDEAADVIRGTEIVFFDYETTGFASDDEPDALNRPVQIGAVRVLDGKVVERFNMYMNPETTLTKWSADNLKQENGDAVTDEWLTTQPSMRDAHERFLEFVGDSPILGGQYIPFDLEVLQRTLDEQGLSLNIAGTIDSKDIAGGTLPRWSAKNPVGPMQIGADGKRRSSNSLGPVAEFLGVDLPNWHRADADAEASWDIIDAMLTRAVDNPDTSTDLLDFEKIDVANAYYKAEREEYEQALAEYEIAKAIAGAWSCEGGLTSSMIAAGEDGRPPCVPPDVDKLIADYNRHKNDESLDPDGLQMGDPSSPSSQLDPLPVDRTDRDGVDVKDPYADEEFPPTDQQRAIVDAVLTGDNVVARALAGTGKTSTLKLIAKRLDKEQPDKRIIYVAFNKSIQLEANASMPGNVEARTADSLSYRAVSKEISSKLGSKDAIVKKKDIAIEFGVPQTANPDYVEGGSQPKMLSSVDTVGILQRAINAFTISADDEIGAQHFAGDMPEEKVTPILLRLANDMWDDIKDPNGKLRVTNSHLTKLWALGRPDLSDVTSGVTHGADIIFFDEAQDINPVLGKVIADQRIQVVYVGDSNQAIYGFRGAVDQLDQIEAPHDLPLTKSWRFGPEVAGVGNRFLTLLGARDRIEGGGPHGEIVPANSMSDADAVLVRTNMGAISEIFSELGRGRKVGVAKNFKSDLQSFNDSARWLRDGGPKPSTVHDEIAPYSSWKEFTDAAEEDGNRKVKMMLELIDEIGFDGIDDMLGRIVVYSDASDLAKPSAGTMPDLGPDDAKSGSSGSLVDGVDYRISGDTVILNGKKMFDNKDKAKAVGFKWNPDDKTWRKSIPGDSSRLSTLNKLRSDMGGGSAGEGVDVVVTTAHRSKGLEWDNVRIGGDFWGPKKLEDGTIVMPADEELKLDYVAVTRAKKKLDTGGLDWVYNHTTDDDESPTPPAPTPEAGDEMLPPPPPPTKAPSMAEGEEPKPEDVIPPPPPGFVEPDIADTPVAETPDDMAPEETSHEIVDPARETGATVMVADQKEIIGDKIDARIEDLQEQIDDLQENGDFKQKKFIPYLEKQKKILEDYKNGSLSREEALDQANAMIDELEKKITALGGEGATSSIDTRFMRDEAVDTRKYLDGTELLKAETGVEEGKGLPPVGSGHGLSKEGVFIKPGMVVRDKWGYRGVVVRYKVNGDDWGYVYVKNDIDHSKPGGKKWGPGVVVVRGTKTLTVLGKDDDQTPWLDIAKGKNAPHDYEKQLEMLKKTEGKDGDDPGFSVETPKGPSDDTGGGEAETPSEPEAGTTEALEKNVEEATKTEAWAGEEGKRAPEADIPKDESTATQQEMETSPGISDEVDVSSIKTGPPSTISDAEKATGAYKKEHPDSKIYTDSRGGQLWFSVKKNPLGERRVFIHGIFVDKDARRQGIATDLLDKLANDYFGRQISPGGLTKDGAPLWKRWTESRQLADMWDPGFPNSKHLMTQDQLDARENGETVDGSDFPYSLAGKPSEPKSSSVEVDNSPEVTAKIGTDISTPDITKDGVLAAPDHTPYDEELISKLVSEGPNALGSEFTQKWVDHVAEFNASGAEDKEASDAVDLVESYKYVDSYDETKEKTKENAYLQNLILGIKMFVETGPQGALSDIPYMSLEGDDETVPTYLDLVSSSRLSTRSFYTDIARYYDDPSLIDSEITPASAFLRAIRSAKVDEDRTYQRVLLFPDPITSQKHPLHRLTNIGQEFDLRPSSWTNKGNIGNLDMLLDGYVGGDPSDPLDDDAIYSLETTGNVVLEVRGVNALEISGLGIPEEQESIVTNGRYKVVSVSRKHKKGFKDFLPYTHIVLEPVGESDKETTPEIQEEAEQSGATGVVDNSIEETSRLGGLISTPDLTVHNGLAYPEHTPQDKELLKKFLDEGPNKPGSSLTRSWTQHIEDFEDSEAVDATGARLAKIAEKIAAGDVTVDEVIEAAIDGKDIELVSFLMGANIFTGIGPGEVKKYHGKGFTSVLGLPRKYKGLENYLDDTRISPEAFYTDIARYLRDPALLDDEITPASMFLRAVRSAGKKEEPILRYIGFDVPFYSKDHPLHALTKIGQEFDLRPSSWSSSSIDDFSKAINDVISGSEHEIGVTREERGEDVENVAEFDKNTGSLVLRISGAEALDISGISQVPSEHEMVPTDGRYRVKGITLTSLKSAATKATANNYPVYIVDLEKIERSDEEDQQEPGQQSIWGEADASISPDLPSLRAAIKSVTGEDNEAHASTLVDGGDIDGLRVNVYKYKEVGLDLKPLDNDSEIEPALMMQFKLGRPALMQFLSDASDSSSSIDDPRSLRKNGWTSRYAASYYRTRLADGVLYVAPSAAPQALTLDGATYSYTDPDLGFTIDVTKTEGSPTKATLSGLVTIRFSTGNPSDEAITAALNKAFVKDARPATNGDFRDEIEKLMFRGLSTDFSRNAKWSKKRKQEELQKIKDNFGITPDDITFSISHSGEISYRMPVEAAKKIAEKTGVTAVSHTITSQIKPGSGSGIQNNQDLFKALADEFYDNFLASVSSDGELRTSLLSTSTRMPIGRQTKGISSLTDLGGTGGEYVFLSPRLPFFVSANYPDGHRGFHLAWEGEDVPRVMTDLNFWANKKDKFGDVTNHSDALGQLSSDSYEYMIKREVPLSTLSRVYTGTEIREYLLDRLRDAGIVKINGVPIEQFISLPTSVMESRFGINLGE